VADRRDEERLPQNADVRLLRVGGPAGQVATGELHDVAAGGLRLQLADPLATGERLLVEVHCEGELLVSVSVSVVWCQPADDGLSWHAGCGLAQPLRLRQLSILQQVATAGRA
jgi:hypothetical protein